MLAESFGAHAASRRNFLWQTGGGLGGVALAWLLGQKACSPTCRNRAPNSTAVCTIELKPGASSNCS